MNKTTVQEAKSALRLIEQQKARASSIARMPLWLNITLCTLMTWFVYFELINRKLMLSEVFEHFIAISVIVLLVIWSRYLNKKGLKVKWFPSKPISYFALAVGLLFGFFSDNIANYSYEALAPWGVYVVPVVTGIVFVYLGHRFPLSQAVSKEAMNELR